jgi:hypothetical protein
LRGGALFIGEPGFGNRFSQGIGVHEQCVGRAVCGCVFGLVS